MKKTIITIATIVTLIGVVTIKNVETSEQGIQINFRDNTGYWVEL